MINVMVWGGFAPFFVEPPRLGVLMVMVAPAGIGPGAAQFTNPPLTKHVGTPPLLMPTVKPLIKSVALCVTLNTTFWAAVCVVLLTTQVMLLVWPLLGFGLCGVPVTETAADVVCVIGAGGLVVLLMEAFARTVPARSLPLAVA